jgi:hypothetical protein
MKTKFQLSLVSALVAASGWAWAQNAPAEAPGGQMGGHAQMQSQMHSQMHGQMQGGQHMHDTTHMQGEHRGQWRAAHQAKRQALFKAQLKLTPEQEGAWTTLMGALQATHHPARPAHPDPLEMAKLSTPERLDNMQALHAQHMGEMSAAMAQRNQAIKTFYAVLAPDQQKVFDALSLHMMGRFMGPGGQTHRQHPHG